MINKLIFDLAFIYFSLGFLFAEPIELGKLDSLNGFYYNNGTLFTGEAIKYLNGGLQRSTFKDGKPHGLWQITNRVGDPTLLCNYVNGKPNGRWQQWYPDGKIEIDANFSDGNYNGSY